MNSESSSKYRILPSPENAPAAHSFSVKGPDGHIFHAYKNQHPSVTATLVVHDRSRDAYLITKRSRPPFEGQFVFPGGFLEVGEESAEQAAARELLEESFIQVNPEQLQLIDVRSSPVRDPRDHIIDIGYYIEVDQAEAGTGDGVSEIRWVSADELNTMPLGFDHSILWRNVKIFMERRSTVLE